MNETLFLAIIAVAAAVLLLGMPFWLFGSRKNGVCVPDPLPGEELNPTTAKEVIVLRKMISGLFAGSVVNDDDRRLVEIELALWQPKTSCKELMQNLVAALIAMPSVNWQRLHFYLREMRDSLAEIAKMKGLDLDMAENTRICRMGNCCLTAALKDAAL